ncbi:hypothetical protein [Streptomyces abikoensis]
MTDNVNTSTGDMLASTALCTGIGTSFDVTADRKIRLSIRLEGNAFLAFERPVDGAEDQWRAGDYTSGSSGYAFDEAISAEHGRGLEHLLHLRADA